MPPKRNSAATTTTSMTDAQLKDVIAQGIAKALAEIKANRSRNGDHNHDSESDGIRRMPVARAYTISDFLKCQPLNFKGTEGVELALLCGVMFPKESDKVEKYFGGLPDMIQGSVMASKPNKMQDAIEFANELMDQKICTLAER
ncbi:hypothetical protein Tco_1031679 [Tanacetum coccineum]|uniref:Reverse transcriptase domain-containing protein n=1 Tax=Tanacetum coccineum TaxID=301880 RepID=A0ABQ5GAQ8_9ASTR